MEDMGNYFRKWREWRNRDLGSKSSMSIKRAENDEVRTINQPIKQNQSINNSINRLNVNMKILAFQRAFNNLSNFSNFITLFPGFNQVCGKFSTVLFSSFVMKSNIFSNNSNIMVASSIQVFINFLWVPRIFRPKPTTQ